MDKPWEALFKALVDAVIESLIVDWAICVDFGPWAWNFASHHWLRLSFWIGFVCCSWRLLHWRSGNQALSPFRWTEHCFKRLHVILWSLNHTFEETKSMGTGTGKAKTPKPASLRKHQRQKSTRKRYGMVEPVIGGSARRCPQ